MLNFVIPFPFLLEYSFFAPLLLRIALGLYILSIAIAGARKKGEAKNTDMILYGTLIVAGVSVTTGLFMQIGALVIALISLGALAIPHQRILPEIHRSIFPFLLAISLSLLLTGAGALAFDYPF